MTDRQSGTVCLVIGMLALFVNDGWMLSSAGALVLLLGITLVAFGER